MGPSWTGQPDMCRCGSWGSSALMAHNWLRNFGLPYASACAISRQERVRGCCGDLNRRDSNHSAQWEKPHFHATRGRKFCWPIRMKRGAYSCAHLCQAKPIRASAHRHSRASCRVRSVNIDAASRPFQDRQAVDQGIGVVNSRR